MKYNVTNQSYNLVSIESDEKVYSDNNISNTQKILNLISLIMSMRLEYTDCISFREVRLFQKEVTWV